MRRMAILVQSSRRQELYSAAEVIPKRGVTQQRTQVEIMEVMEQGRQVKMNMNRYNTIDQENQKCKEEKENWLNTKCNKIKEIQSRNQKKVSKLFKGSNGKERERHITTIQYRIKKETP